MSNMSLYGLTVAIVISSMFALVFGLASFQLGTSYNQPVPTQYQGLFNEYNATQSIQQQNSQIIESGEINTQAQDLAVFKDSITATKQIGTSGKLVATGIGQVGTIIPVRAEVLSMLKTILYILIAGAFLYLIFGRRP